MAFSLDDLSLSDLFESFSLKFKQFQFGTKHQLAFLEDFYVLVNDGIPANRAIEMMSQVTTGITREAALSIAQKISEGQPLATGMRDWFSMNVVEIVRVGEEGGVLNQTLKSAINTLTQQKGILGSVAAAFTYPLMVILTACIMMVYLNNGVFEQFRAIKPIEEWPSAGQQFVSAAVFIQGWWWLVVLFVVVLIVGFRILLTNYTGSLRSMLDQVPPFSLYRQFVAARFMETLGLLIANGVVFKNAIKVLQYQANPYLSSHLVMMEHYIGTGKGNVADVLDTGLIEESDITRLRVLAEVKGFEHGLTRMGIRGAEQMSKTMQLGAKIAGGILLGIGAVLIIVIVRGIYLTGMSMGNT